MKHCRVCILLAVFLAVAGEQVFAVPAEELPVPGVSLGRVVVDGLGSASVPVVFASSGRSVAALQFDIRYSIVVSSLLVSAGDAITGAGKGLVTSGPDPTALRVLISGLGRNAIPDGVIATLFVQLKSGPPSGFHQLTIENVVGADGAGNAVFVQAASGAVVVPGDGTVAPEVLAVANAASYMRGAIAPGEIIVIGGRLLGTDPFTSLQLDQNGLVATSLGGTRVLFDGVPAPLVYTAQAQLAAIVPYGVHGQPSVSVQVEFQETLSAPVLVSVAGDSPGIFTVDQSGQGQGAIVNEDGAPNGPDAPAPRGTIVSIYGTGEGQTTPAGVDGSIVGASNLRRPVLPVAATIGGERAEVLYAGSAGNQVSGLFQMNVRVPLSIPPGDAVPVTFSVGESDSQTGVTMAIQ